MALGQPLHHPGPETARTRWDLQTSGQLPLRETEGYARVSNSIKRRAVQVEGRGSWSRGRGLGWGRGVKAALTAQHVIVGVICHRIYVGRGLRAALSLVSGYHGGCIDREPFVGVDGDTEEARVCLRRECIDRLLEAKFPSPGSSPRKTVTLAKSPKELLKVRCHTLCGRPSPALALTPTHSPWPLHSPIAQPLCCCSSAPTLS